MVDITITYLANNLSHIPDQKNIFFIFLKIYSRLVIFYQIQAVRQPLVCLATSASTLKSVKYGYKKSLYIAPSFLLLLFFFYKVLSKEKEIFT